MLTRNRRAEGVEEEPRTTVQTTLAQKDLAGMALGGRRILQRGRLLVTQVVVVAVLVLQRKPYSVAWPQSFHL
jgi:hypothetical protein